VLFVAFGGFLTGVVPPKDADAKFAVGVSSFVALIVLFLCSALSNKRSAARQVRFGLHVPSFV
jgi:hypothetical protein